MKKLNYFKQSFNSEAFETVFYSGPFLFHKLCVNSLLASAGQTTAELILQ